MTLINEAAIFFPQLPHFEAALHNDCSRPKCSDLKTYDRINIEDIIT